MTGPVRLDDAIADLAAHHPHLRRLADLQPKETPMTAPTDEAPAGRDMTPEEFRAFFLGQPEDRQLVIAGQILDNATTATRCFTENHPALLEQVQSMGTTLAAMTIIHTGVAADLERAAEIMTNTETSESVADVEAHATKLRALAIHFREAAGEPTTTEES